VLSADTLFLTVGELGAQIRARKISPVELTESYLERARQLGARWNAFATLMPDLALEQARAAEKEIAAGKIRGPLHGIPFAAKDLLAVKGYPTTWGARPYANQKFEFNATIIDRLQAAGAILLGKAAMIELAGGLGYRFASASATGPAHNPWNEGCWTCGSSSGSGAIVSGALAAFAIGTETWGSIVCPAAFCGISGLRPTYGRVSRHGAMALAFSMDKIGPMARSAADCGLVLAAIAGHDPLDPGSLPTPDAAFRYPPPAQPRARQLRIGWLNYQDKFMAPAVKSALDAAPASLKKAGMTVSEAQLPEGPWEAAANVVISVEGAAAFSSLIESGRVAELSDPIGRIGGYINEQVAASDFMRAMRVRSVLQRKIDAVFDKFDLLATATVPAQASKIEANLETELSTPDPLGAIGNLCGLPGISVPCGFSDEKLPIGLLLVGSALGEHTVLRAARAFQGITDWHRRRPPAA
jgi:aspartyl-tRNA(Asn)/glutamyl-tRNA(Gln) amidotransferase subunit A